MPRITAGSVAEHVAQQERAVFDAAIALFTERGYGAVSLGDIAKAVGLARNSLYRYFPTKAAILLRWYSEEVPAQIEQSERLLGGADPPVARIERWAVAQLDYAQQPEHRLLVAVGEAAADLDADARVQLAASHDQLLAPLAAAIAEAGAEPEEQAAVADQIWGAILVQSRRELAGSTEPGGRAVLARVIEGLVGS